MTAALDPDRRVFLTAAWRYLVMLSYEVDPRIVTPLVPPGTVLDPCGGRALVSVVGFRFLDTRVFGLSVPFHRDFDEVNLRFYVRRLAEDGTVRRGVVFARELVPRAAIALLARLAYNEPYRAVAMRSTVPSAPVTTPGRLGYAWRFGGVWHRLAATAVGEAVVPAPGSEERFVTEHHWGYGRRRDGRTVEYQVAHPPWRVWRAEAPLLTSDVAGLCGPAFAAALSAPAVSALVAEGSPVAVSRPRALSIGSPRRAD